MPAAKADSESSAGEDIPFREKNAEKQNDDQEGSTEDEDEEEEFVVEKILDHKIDKKGNVRLHVKWEGWPVEESTWEPEHTLAHLDEVKKYYRHIGGRPSKNNTASRIGNQNVGAKRKSAQAESETSIPTHSQLAKRSKKDNDHLIYDTEGREPFAAPNGLWEDHIIGIDTILDADEECPVRQAIVIWRNNRKSKHRLPVLNSKCPQRMLQFYESNLRFTSRGQIPFNDDFIEADNAVDSKPVLKVKGEEDEDEDDEDGAEEAIKDVVAAY